MSRHDVAFVKVLAAVAWADGTIEESELNRIKSLLNGFHLDLADRKQVDHLLSTPVGFEEAVAPTTEFGASPTGPAARHKLLAEVEEMLGPQADRTPQERALLQHVRAILDSHTPLDGLVDKLRGAFGSFRSRPAPPNG